MNAEPPPSIHQQHQHQSVPSASERPVPSVTIMQGARCVQISHRGVIYRLQETRLGKLILTK